MTALPAAPVGRPLIGIAIVAFAVMNFALGDTLTKALTERFPVPAIIAARFWINFVLLVIFLGPRHGARLWRTTRTWLVVLRGLILAMGSLSMGFALRLIPVGEATSLVYLAPIVVILLSTPILGERPTRVSVAGAAVGFCGVLLIARPGSGLNPEGVLWALTGVVVTAFYHLTTRLLARTETAVSMQFYSALVGALVFTPLSLAGPAVPMPDGLDLARLMGVGVAMTAGHYLFTLAYREAPATLIAPFTYLQLLWAVMLGWLVFGHVPDWISTAGIALIAGSGAAIAATGHMMSRRVPPPPAG
ncbi:DMT family transporter [Celeribacter indicus]|uniref:Putative permease, DMT superfamily protein n=1 Tax=Celeribacter indicus TaxID=1208324 RepID=A0A0B5E834_9RHOB|nr:DMT family transporter [Celeribacter indicus]AJE49176.1 putative permease, DMT superfamily protein [Celeribacter indicus]SDX18174.1 Threonine/homoserine efflux transporter RhtA [Celeribacter indicus]